MAKMIKRLLSFAVVTCIMFNIYVPMVLARYNDTIELSERQNEATLFLDNTKILGGVAKEEYGVNEIVSFEEYVITVLKLIKLDGNFGTLQTAYELGLIDKYMAVSEEGIGYTDAITVMVRALGYELIAESKGGYPSGYITVAKEIEVLKGINMRNSHMTRADVALLLFNCLEIEMLMQLSYGGKVMLRPNNGHTILNTYMGLERGRGIVDGNEYTYITKESGTGKGKISIDDKLFAFENADVNRLLGLEVIYYYETEGKSDIPRIVYLSETKQNQVEIIEEKDIVSVSFQQIQYYGSADTKDRVHKLNIPAGTDFIYNGVVSLDYDIDLVPQSGYIEAVDNNDDGIVEVIKITSYDTYIVDYVSVKEFYIYDKFEPRNTLNLLSDDIRSVSIENMSGKAISIADIKEWDVLSVAEGKFRSGEKSYRIVVTSNKIAEKVSEISDESIMLNGIQYDFSKYYVEHFITNLDFDIHYNFYLDCMGRIAAVDNEAAEKQIFPGFIMVASQKADLAKNIMLKLFTVDGKFVIYELENRVEIDKITYRSSSSNLSVVLNAIAAGGSINKLVKYKVNDAGRIYQIDTGSGAYDGGLAKSGPYARNIYKTDFSGIRDTNGIMLRLSGAKIITVPSAAENMADEKCYKVLPLSYFILDNNYTIWAAYNVNDDKIPEVAILQDLYVPTFGDSYDITLVTRIATVLNEDGEQVSKIYGLLGGRELGLECTNTVQINFKEGDIIRVAQDSLGRVTTATKLCERELLLGGNDYNQLSGATTIRDLYIRGKLYKKTGMTLYIDYGKTTGFDPVNQVVAHHNKPTVYIYESAAGKATVGSVVDLMDYTTFGNNQSKVFAYTRYMVTKLIVLYK